MSIIRNILFLNLLLIICSSFVCSFPSTEEKNDKPKEDASDSAEGESETASPKEIDKSKEENENESTDKVSPEEVANPEEEKDEDEKELPEESEEEVEANSDDEDFKKLEPFFALVDKAKSESSDTEEKEVDMSPAEMKKLKEESFELANKLNEREGTPAVSQEKFDEIWDKMEKEHGKKFPVIMGRVIHLGKITEENEEPIIEKEEKISEKPLEVSTEVSETVEVPKDAFVVRSAEGKVCLLAKFHYTIKITYSGKIHKETVYVNTNRPGETSGNCGGPNEQPSLHRTWDTNNFTLIFDKTSEDTWGVTSVQLTYDIMDFDDDAMNSAKVEAKSKSGKWFETPFKRSYFCPAEEVIFLYNKDEHVVTVGMTEVHLQPYDVEDGKFSTSYRCDKVVIGGVEEEPFVRDETVPLAVGCTLALITLLILIGFSVHRAYYAAKVDYNTVE